MQLWIPILVLFVALAIADDDDSDYEEEIEWECGTDAFSKYISENQISMDCPKLKKSINQCCLDHDKCYDDQLGRKHCDDVFCNCLDVMSAPSQICNKEDAPLFCGLVREFGGDAYLRSGNTTETESTIIENSPSNSTDYDTLEKDVEHIEAQINKSQAYP